MVIIILAIWIVLSNGLFLFFWEATNLGDVVIYERVKPLICKLEEFKYKTPYSKIEKDNITQSEWETFQKVGAELMKQNPCPEYKDYVWFNQIEENIDSNFQEWITE